MLSRARLVNGRSASMGVITDIWAGSVDRLVLKGNWVTLTTEHYVIIYLCAAMHLCLIKPWLRDSSELWHVHEFVCNKRCSDLSQAIRITVLCFWNLSGHSQTKSMATVYIHGYLSEWLCLQIYSCFCKGTVCLQHTLPGSNINFLQHLPVVGELWHFTGYKYFSLVMELHS